MAAPPGRRASTRRYLLEFCARVADVQRMERGSTGLSKLRGGRPRATPPAGEEARRDCGVVVPCLGEACRDLALLSDRQATIDRDQYRKHDQRGDGRPLDQEADHDEQEAGILWVSDVSVRPVSRQTPRTSCRP